MKYKYHIVSVFFCLLLAASGCKVGPNYQSVQVEEPEKYYFSDQDTLGLGDLNWWELFGDPALDSLIRFALNSNRDVLIAAKNVEQAQIQLKIQKAELLPKFDVQGNINYGTLQGTLRADEPANAYVGSVNLNWEIDFWGKFRRLNESAQAEYLATASGLRSLQISLISTVAQSYFQLLDFKARLAISQRTLALRDSTLNLIQSRFDAGIVPEIDVNQAAIQRAIAASAVPRFERAVAQAENTLSVLVGVNPQRVSHINTLFDQPEVPAIPTGLPSDLLTRRPDILQAEQFVISENARVGVAVAMRFPSISLTGLVGVASAEILGITNSGAGWSVGGNLVGPLFHWGQNRRRVEAQRRQWEASVLNYEAVVLNSFKEVEDALIGIETLHDEVIAREQHVDAANNARILSGERYDKGVTSYLEYLESQRQEFEAGLALAEVKQQLLSAYAELYRALGGGWLSEQEQQDANAANQQGNN